MARPNERHIVVSPQLRKDIELAKDYLEKECGFYSVSLKEAADLIRHKAKKGYMTKDEIRKLFSSIRSFGTYD